MGEKASSGLSIAQVIAGALASVSAAVVASKFGVAGTIIGAAISSVTVTIGSVLYRRSIEGAHERVRTRYRRSRNDVDEGGADFEYRVRPHRRLAWGAIAGGTVLVFVLAMGGLTAFETVARTSAARLMGQSSGDARTTVGAVLQNVTPDESGPASPGPEPDQPAASDIATPQAAPTEVEPSPTPSVEPDPDAGKPAATEPATVPSQSPAVKDPVPSGPVEPVESPAIQPVKPAG